MIAVISQFFNTPSETFIRDHVRHLAPGRTVLICQEPDGADQFGYPVLSGVPRLSPLSRLHSRIVNVARLGWLAYVREGMSRSDEDRVVEFLKAHKVDAALVEYLTMGALFAPACRRAGVRLYAHAHGADSTVMPRKQLWRRRYRRLFAIADGIITPSRFIADRLSQIGCPNEKLHVSPCGVLPERFTPSKRESGRLLFVGRFVEKKSPHLAIEAFARIASKFPEAQLDFVGDGPLMARSKALVEQENLSDRVIFHGSRSIEYVQGMMQDAAIFVQHSVTARNGDMEGLPVSILEAMASALPVVATRHSGIPEAVVDGKTGILVEEHDIESMAEALASLLAEPHRAAKMGDAGRQRVLDHFTQRHTRDRLRHAMMLPTIAEPLDFAEGQVQ
ncbi:MULTISPECIES: glycosyltransferase [unclassified Mesorhizobium]|uniref:glycosyltransferase n=1 Tax=unclassified Mesorhizobium TaxID=325217 RepID=UPI000F7559C3|nr:MULTISPECIES: glycosyltransferase [unclassified Mesorhizobium]AZO63897.1 glycosyltransferase [Mesorhizobium sp. M6A.T.Cr.TU.016.01.1.1]RWP54866.1 MAG: glycosyltransferase [Mesorhizobium sp.]RWQ81295.1 MAG: glycosyltransferase [Mesorhizobium sp.]